ncbi:hypothetical protein HBI42_019520 [Parastagonospora nodorum]|nr:hypothetical protein HBI12_027330 [Parastagonospora nodorum]KAH6235146.1 hypothetical protein HBI43_015360 [Parastagonospora nodorum]KAH6272735.1 hypothetical protein HBI42_019520 [Parastagonospora nodorum]
MVEHNRWMTGSNRADAFLDNLETRNSQPLKRRSRTFWLLIVYTPLITLPWILTCILAQRPVNASSYIYQKGFSDSELRSLRRWKNAVDILNSIAGLITIPVLSTLLTQAAVVFCQRTGSGQFLSVQDLFALADRGWTNAATIYRSMRSKPDQSIPGAKWGGSFLLPAICLILLGALQQPLYQILVHMEGTSVTTCSDVGYQYMSPNATHCEGNYPPAHQPIGIDIEPARMALIYHTPFLQRLGSDLASVTRDAEQPNLWNDKMPADAWRVSKANEQTYYKSLKPWLSGFTNPYNDYEMPEFFVAAIPTNSTTGVLRQHAMRFNSSVQCKSIERTSFPSTCPGKMPFFTDIRKSNETSIRVCVPGEVGAFPWTKSRNRQDIIEELYLDLWDGDVRIANPNEGQIPVNATIRCEARTTRAYFELGNSHNNNTYGPLLTQWPSRDQMEENSNDWVETDFYNGFIPSEMDDYEGEDRPQPFFRGASLSGEWRVSGPLTTFAIALFGNTSWIHNAVAYTANMTWESAKDLTTVSWHQPCAGMPFGLVRSSYSDYRTSDFCRLNHENILRGLETQQSDWLGVIHAWVRKFAPIQRDVDRNVMATVESLLQVSLFAANRALLTFYSPDVAARDETDQGYEGRIIRSSPGMKVQKPVLGKAAVIALSLVIALQLLGLTYLAYYIYHVPTWSVALDAMAIARIGVNLGNEGLLPPIGPVTAKDYDALRHVDGLIGLGGIQDGMDQTQRLSPSPTSDDGSSDVELQLVETKGVYVDVEAQSPSLQLELGASGMIAARSGDSGLARRRKDEDDSTSQPILK